MNTTSDEECPTGTTHLATQVAGHTCDDKNYSFGLLVKSGRYVLKPVVKETHGKREIDFYRKVSSSDDPVCLELKTLIPEFYGTELLTWNESKGNYIVLSNLTHGMEQPCVMDIKIGKQTWDPEATDYKKQKEMAKYAKTKQYYGFCIPGFQVYNATTGEYSKFGKAYGEALTEESIKDAFKMFFNFSHESGKSTLGHILERLKKIAKWFTVQNDQFHFYSSSILIAYDAKVLNKCPMATVNMIDFAHVFPATEKDSNYTFGVQKLVEVLEEIMLK